MKNLCVDCHWLLIGPGARGPSYECELTGRTRTAAMIWRKACKDFVPVLEHAPVPQRKPRSR